MYRYSAKQILTVHQRGFTGWWGLVGGRSVLLTAPPTPLNNGRGNHDILNNLVLKLSKA